MAIKRMDATQVLQFMKTDKTAQEVALQFGVAKLTASRVLADLAKENKVVLTGTRKSGGRGRPQFVYRTNDGVDTVTVTSTETPAAPVFLSEATDTSTVTAEAASRGPTDEDPALLTRVLAPPQTFIAVNNTVQVKTLKTDLFADE